MNSGIVLVPVVLLAVLPASAQDTVLRRHERFAIGLVACQGAEVSIEAMVTTRKGEKGPSQRSVLIKLAETASPHLNKVTALTDSEAKRLQLALADLFEAEISQPRPPSGHQYLGGGVAVAGRFLEHSVALQELTFTTRDTGMRRFLLVSSVLPAITAACETPAGIAQLKQLVDSALSVLDR